MFNATRLTVVVGLILLVNCATPEKREVGPEPAARAALPGDHAGGQAIYDANCGSCHRLGGYDSEGKGNLQRRAHHIDMDFLGEHHGGSLSPADVANLRAFISNQ